MPTSTTDSIHSCHHIRRPRLQVPLCVTHTHTHTHPFNGPLWPRPRWASTRKVKPISILLKQETGSGSGISWAIRKSASRSRQITTPAPHHSVFYRPDALPAAQPTVSKHWRPLCIGSSEIRHLSWWHNKLNFSFSAASLPPYLALSKPERWISMNVGNGKLKRYVHQVRISKNGSWFSHTGVILSSFK